MMRVLCFPALAFSLVLAFAVPGRAVPVDAVLKSILGSVQTAPPGSTKFAAVTPGTKLPSGTTIKTGPDSEAIIVPTPGSAIRLDENTTLEIDGMSFEKDKSNNVTERKAVLNLTSGTVTSLIDHSTPAVTDFTVRTPQGAASARGTFYAVTVKDGQTYLKVEEGKVGVTSTAKPAAAAAPKPPVPVPAAAKPKS